MKEEDAKRKKRIEETNRIIWDGHQSSIAMLMQQKMEQAISNPPSAPVISSIPTIGPSFAQPSITSFSQPQHPEVPNNSRDLISSWMTQEQKIDSFSNSETDNHSSIKNNEIPQMSQPYTTNPSIPVSIMPLPAPTATATATATSTATPTPMSMPLSSLPNMPPQIPTIPPVPLPMSIPIPMPIPMPPPVSTMPIPMSIPMSMPMPMPMSSATLPIAIGMPMSMPMPLPMPTMSFGLSDM